MAELNKNIAPMLVASEDACFTGQGGGDSLTTCTLYSSSQLLFFSHCQSNSIDSLHNDHRATFHNCIDLKNPVVGMQLMVYVHVTSSAKGRGMQSLLEKPTSKICIFLPHTHAHGSM